LQRRGELLQAAHVEGASRVDVITADDRDREWHILRGFGTAARGDQDGIVVARTGADRAGLVSRCKRGGFGGDFGGKYRGRGKRQHSRPRQEENTQSHRRSFFWVSRCLRWSGGRCDSGFG
jgi:hypothetical protein